MAQKRRPRLRLGLINGLADGAGGRAQRNPREVAARAVAARAVVALGVGLATLAFFSTGELLEASMKFCHLPAYSHRLDAHCAAQVGGQVSGNLIQCGRPGQPA